MIGWITVVVCLLAGLFSAGQGRVIVGFAVVISGCVSAGCSAPSRSMRWMAAMGELAARGFVPEESPIDRTAARHDEGDAAPVHPF